MLSVPGSCRERQNQVPVLHSTDGVLCRQFPVLGLLKPGRRDACISCDVVPRVLLPIITHQVTGS